MEKRQIEKLRIWVKKRFDEAGLDYKTFDFDAEIDSSLSYSENKQLITEQINLYFPELKTTNKAKHKEEERKLNDEQFRAVEVQAKLEFEKQLDKILKTKSSEALDKLYVIPRQYIAMVLESKAKGLLLYGESGLGKSYNVKRELAKHKLKEQDDFVFLSGHVTPLQFYKKLCENRDKLIILDDINILESKINLNMLKAALNDDSHNRVEYHSSFLRDLEPSFLFTGRIIILLNTKPKHDENLKAVENRIYSYELKMTWEQKIQALLEVAKCVEVGIEKAERIAIVDWVKSQTNQATRNLSIRFLFHCFEFYKWDKDKWKDLAISLLQHDEYLTLIIQGCSETDFCAKTGLSRPTYYRYKQKVSKSHQSDMPL